MRSTKYKGDFYDLHETLWFIKNTVFFVDHYLDRNIDVILY